MTDRFLPCVLFPTVTLVPYVTFSLFHVLTFFRTTVIPMAFPSAAPAPAGKTETAASQTAPAKASKFVQTWVKKNYDPAMRFVAYSEVFIFARILLGAVTLRNSLLAPLLYAHFLRLRFYMSSFTRAAFQHVGGVLDNLTNKPECPPFVRKGYLTLMDLINRYASTVLSVPANGAGGAAGTTGASSATSGSATGVEGAATSANRR